MLRFKKPAASPAAAAAPAPTTEAATTEAAPSSSSSAETTTEAKPAESTEMEVEGEAAPTEGGEAKVSLVGGIGGVKVVGQKKGKRRTPGELRVQKGKIPSVPRRQYSLSICLSFRYCGTRRW